MGIVSLPCIDDYLSTHLMTPTNGLCNQFDMSRNRFRFIWHLFHCNHTIENDFQPTSSNNNEIGEDNGDLIEQRIERVQYDQEGNENGNDQDPPTSSKRDSALFEKLDPLIYYVCGMSMDHILILGTNLALDEMMIRFVGRSIETHRMKNKPIAEVFIFFF